MRRLAKKTNTKRFSLQGNLIQETFNLRLRAALGLEESLPPQLHSKSSVPTGSQWSGQPRLRQ
jgi:hypothetical protein